MTGVTGVRPQWGQTPSYGTDQTCLFGTTSEQVIRISLQNATDGKVTVATRRTVLDLAGACD